MNRSKIVNTLIKEGFSSETLVSFNDKQLMTLHERIVTTTKAIQSNPELKKLADDPVKSVEVQESGKKNNDTIMYKGISITKLHPSGYFEFRSSKEGKFKKADTLGGVKKMIDAEQTSKKSDVKESDNIEKKCKKCGSKKCTCKSKEDKTTKVIKKLKEHSDAQKFVNSLIENQYHSLTTKNEIMELIKTKLTEEETMNPMPKSKPKKGHNGIPEFMTYDSIKTSNSPDVAPSKPKVAPGTKPTSPSKPKKTPFNPGPRIDPKPKAIKENKK